MGEPKQTICCGTGAPDSTSTAQPCHSLPAGRAAQTLQALLLWTLTAPFPLSTPRTRTSTSPNRPPTNIPYKFPTVTTNSASSADDQHSI